jgi:hypothetical protein
MIIQQRKEPTFIRFLVTIHSVLTLLFFSFSSKQKSSAILSNEPSKTLQHILQRQRSQTCTRQLSVEARHIHCETHQDCFRLESLEKQLSPSATHSTIPPTFEPWRLLELGPASAKSWNQNVPVSGCEKNGKKKICLFTGFRSLEAGLNC